MVASLLGHSPEPKKKKKPALCSCAQTQVDHMGCPPCMTQGADHTHSSTPEPDIGEQQKEGPSAMSGGRQTSEGQCAIGGVQDDVKGGKTASGSNIQNTEHNSPPRRSGGTCSGVPARVTAPWTSCVRVPIHRWAKGAMTWEKWSDDPDRNVRRRTHPVRGRRGVDRSDPCSEHETGPWMDEDPVGPHHGVPGGPVGYKHGMTDRMGARG